MSTPRERFVKAMGYIYSKSEQAETGDEVRQAAEAFADEAGKTDCTHLMNDHLPHCSDCRAALLKEIGL